MIRYFIISLFNVPRNHDIITKNTYLKRKEKAVYCDITFWAYSFNSVIIKSIYVTYDSLYMIRRWELIKNWVGLSQTPTKYTTRCHHCNYDVIFWILFEREPNLRHYIWYDVESEYRGTRQSSAHRVCNALRKWLYNWAHLEMVFASWSDDLHYRKPVCRAPLKIFDELWERAQGSWNWEMFS